MIQSRYTRGRHKVGKLSGKDIISGTSFILSLFL